MSSCYNATTFMLSNAELGVLSFINVVFSVAGSLGNILVFLAFVNYRNLRSTMNIFILNLACSDLLVCLVAQPMFVASLVKCYQQESTTNVFEHIRKRLTWISLLASAGNLLGVTLDRYVAVSQPLMYPARVTTARAAAFVTVVWLVALGLGSATESYRTTKMVGQIYVLLLLICIIFPLYCRVLCIARKHARVIHTATSPVTRTLNKEARAEQHALWSSVRQADRNSLKTVGIISGIFFLGWFPILLIPFLYRAKVFDERMLLTLFQWVNTLALCSSAANPFVYSWRDQRFRKQLRRIYSRWKDERVVSVQNRRAAFKIKDNHLKSAKINDVTILEESERTSIEMNTD